jgi:hypothetical protein
MYGETFIMQNFIYNVLQYESFTYKLDLLEEIKCLYDNFNARKSWAKDSRKEEGQWKDENSESVLDYWLKSITSSRVVGYCKLPTGG